MKQKIILILIFCNTFVYSQKIDNVNFDAKDNVIIVNFDLIECPTNAKYDVSVKFIDENKKIIYPKTIGGDLSNLTCGRNREITWDVLKDIDELSGKVQAIIEISKIHNTKIVGGPANAFLSLLIPGLGDYFVTLQKDNYLITPYYITGAVLGAFSTGYTNYNSSNGASSDYKTYLGLGAAVWIGDVIYVAYRGFKNKNEQLGLANKNRTNFGFICDNKNILFKYTINF